VERRRVHVGDRKLWALTYNGHYMAPTLRIRPGDRLDLAMQNRLDRPTNLHVHGLHVSPTGNSDNVIYVHIQPGQTFHYSYRFPGNLAPGTYWYHSHEDPISAPQVAGGMPGLIVVDGLKRYLPFPPGDGSSSGSISPTTPGGPCFAATSSTTRTPA